MRTKTDAKNVRNGYFNRTYQALPQLDDPRPSLLITLFGLLYVAFYTFRDYIPFLAKLGSTGKIIALIIMIAVPGFYIFSKA